MAHEIHSALLTNDRRETRWIDRGVDRRVLVECPHLVEEGILRESVSCQLGATSNRQGCGAPALKQHQQVALVDDGVTVEIRCVLAMRRHRSPSLQHLDHVDFIHKSVAIEVRTNARLARGWSIHNQYRPSLGIAKPASWTTSFVSRHDTSGADVRWFRKDRIVIELGLGYFALFNVLACSC